ncbi:MAG: hypothetical protein ACJ8G7_22610 [Rhizobacter sp.]
MADRPIDPEYDPEVDIPAPVWVPPSMRLTKEQLAAAQRTREYHLRKLLNGVARNERGAELGMRSER